MLTYNQKLGNIIKTYRKSKNISTQELSNRLNVSVGCINHIENAKNNVFKLDLLFKIIKELNIPINEILLYNSLLLENINLNPINDKLEIVFKNFGASHVDLLKENIKLIVNTYLETVLECSYDYTAIEFISKHILNELEYSKNLITLKK